jgi:hypothetical protein
MKNYVASILLLPFAAAAADTNSLPALAPACGELPPAFWEQHQTTIIIGCFAFLAFVFLFVKTLLRPEIPKMLPPETVARQALAQLQNQPEDGSALSLISQILRRYVGESFNLPDQELTTTEFCAAIAGNPQIGMELAESISGFLRECDVRKFSPASGASPLNAASRVLELVEQAEKRLLPVGRASSRAESEADGSSAASPHQPSAK